MICKICQSIKIEMKNIGHYKFLHCRDCDIHISNINDVKNVDEYYKQTYQMVPSDIVETEFRRFSRSPEQYQLVSEIMSFVGPPANLLDIGCDRGFFIDQARRFGYECTGVELGKAAIAYAGNSGLEIRENLNELQKKYQIAVMWHSLEHFPDPTAFLNELSGHIDEKGYLFIRVPAFDCIYRKILGLNWIWTQPQNHLFHFSKRSLHVLLEKAGFEVLSITHRRPNNYFTRKQFALAWSLFSKHMGMKISLKKFLVIMYEELTGVELYAVSRKK